MAPHRLILLASLQGTGACHPHAAGNEPATFNTGNAAPHGTVTDPNRLHF